jgi:hypothetical protein
MGRRSAERTADPEILNNQAEAGEKAGMGLELV